MDELKTHYESLNLLNVKTYIQSGNIVFSSQIKDELKIKEKNEKMIQSEFGYSVSTLVKTKEGMRRVIQNNPFPNITELDYSKFLVTFLHSKPDNSLLEKLHDFKSGNDKFVYVDSEIYLFCPDGYGRTKFTNNIFESKLNVAATARNWRTINKLNEIAEEI